MQLNNSILNSHLTFNQYRIETKTKPSQTYEKIRKILAEIKITYCDFLDIDQQKIKCTLKKIKHIVIDRQVLLDSLQSPKTSFFKGLGKVILSVLGLIGYTPIFMLGCLAALMNGTNGASLLFLCLQPYLNLKRNIDVGCQNMTFPFKQKEKILNQIADKNDQLRLELNLLNESYKDKGRFSEKIQSLQKINQELENIFND